VREVIHNFNRDGFEALYPRYRGGRPRLFTLQGGIARFNPGIAVARVRLRDGWRPLGGRQT
jgi:hypothetical protein